MSVKLSELIFGEISSSFC